MNPHVYVHREERGERTRENGKRGTGSGRSRERQQAKRPTSTYPSACVCARVRTCVCVRACVTYDNLPPGSGAPPECDVRTPTRPNPPLHFFRGGHGVPRVNSEGRPSRGGGARGGARRSVQIAGGGEEAVIAREIEARARTFLELSAADIAPDTRSSSRGILTRPIIKFGEDPARGPCANADRPIVRAKSLIADSANRRSPTRPRSHHDQILDLRSR